MHGQCILACTTICLTLCAPRTSSAQATTEKPYFGAAVTLARLPQPNPDPLGNVFPYVEAPPKREHDTNPEASGHGRERFAESANRTIRPLARRWRRSVPPYVAGGLGNLCGLFIPCQSCLLWTAAL